MRHSKEIRVESMLQYATMTFDASLPSQSMNGRHAGPPGQPNVQTYLVTLSHIVFALSAFRVRAQALLFLSASCGKTHPSRTAIRMQRRSLDALSFRAHLDVLALRAALLTSLRLPEIEFTSR